MRALLILVSLGLLIMGGQAIFTTLTNLDPGSYTLEEYHQQRPKDKWLELKNCQLNVLAASFETSLGKSTPEMVYIPIRPAEAEETDETVVLLAAEDLALRQLVEKMNRIEQESTLLAFVGEHSDALFPTKDIKGLVRFGVEMDEGDRSDLRKLDSSLAKDFVVIDEGSKPSWLRAAMLPAGLLLGAIGIFSGRGQQQVPPPLSQAPPAIPGAQPPAGPPPLR